jgi:hypothetical protein
LGIGHQLEFWKIRGIIGGWLHALGSGEAGRLPHLVDWKGLLDAIRSPRQLSTAVGALQ